MVSPCQVFSVWGFTSSSSSANSERVGWNRFLHDGSIEDAGNNYDVSILTGLTTWRLLFPDDDIKAEMVSLP